MPGLVSKFEAWSIRSHRRRDGTDATATNQPGSTSPSAADYLDRRIHTTAQTRGLVAQLQRLGHTVTITPAA